MIAIMPEWPDDELIEERVWQIVHVSDRDFAREIFDKPLPSPPKNNGFRSAPLNPAKRIKSPKGKKRR